ncbi:4Fe-4S dicluster domain-containing protein [Desulforamulus hydrothermalis]|uniref:4Fe-4S dicluster domain-containing protein n=1 Tax=Desulforamulus hydrothermalis TaxID=412895 RepID=UPI0006622D21|nr:4Fe-4S dicluster domain-containing protein [Desulforamulus hydrothermalis]SHH16795.1 Fe-S-cluster-containing dehydrogenase component [Desulforamulus hydrothermalis Lam5 = DSM 18033]
MAKILHAKYMAKCIGCYSCMLACARVTKHSFSLAKSAIQIRTAGGLQSRFLADICRGCEDPACAQACHYGALLPRAGGGVKFIPDKCIGCQDCVEACVVKTIRFDQESNKPVICIQCGTCTRFCPHRVITMEERENGR